MSDKDPIEELFRQEAQESMNLEKPRELVWQKIETNLQPKKKQPIRDFVEGIWFSAAVFALIAVPYFYFFLENMNVREQNTNMVQSTVEELLIPSSTDTMNSTTTPTEILDKIEEDQTLQVAKNEPQKSLDQESIEIVDVQPLEQVSRKKDTLSSTKMFAKEAVIVHTETKVKELKDTVLEPMKPMAATAKVDVSNSAVVQNEQKKAKENNPLQVLPSRFIVQDNVNRVSFEYVRNSEDRIVFKNGSIKLFLERQQGIVKVSTNSTNLKPEILEVVKSKKELLFNYYINYKKK